MRMQVRLYEAVVFPLEWKLKKVLLEDIVVVDASILHIEAPLQGISRGWWMIGFSQDKQISCFHAEHFMGPWRPVAQAKGRDTHPKQGRPAGSLFAYQGHVYRYVQVPGRYYGESVSVHRVTMLHPEAGMSEEDVNEAHLFPAPWIAPKSSAWSSVRLHHVSIVSQVHIGAGPGPFLNGTFLAALDGDSRGNGWRLAGFWWYLSVSTAVAGLAQAAVCTTKQAVAWYTARRPSPLAQRIAVATLLLLTVCIYFHLHVQWPFLREAFLRTYLPPNENTVAGADRLTVIIPSYTPRLEFIMKTVAHYSTCPRVGHIEVVWNMRGADDIQLNADAFDGSAQRPVIVRRQHSNNILNRWKTFGQDEVCVCVCVCVYVCT
jgi:hypothetical protein